MSVIQRDDNFSHSFPKSNEYEPDAKPEKTIFIKIRLHNRMGLQPRRGQEERMYIYYLDKVYIK